MANPWGPAEVDRLDQLAGDVPICSLAEYFNRWARKNGYPERSRRALTDRAHAMGLSLIPVGRWMRTTTIAGILGVHEETIRRWVARYHLPAVLDGSSWTVRRRDLVQFAKRRPELFGRTPAPVLLMLLENNALAEKISAAHPRKLSDCRRVRNLDTLKIYPSATEAARRHFITRQTMATAIRTGGTAAGYHWAWAE